MTYMQLPKSLQRYASRIADYSDERSSDSGIHVAYKSGWKSFTDPLGCVHGDVSDNVKKALYYVRAAEPCDCDECKKDGL
jgi:hypothetical protein